MRMYVPSTAAAAAAAPRKPPTRQLPCEQCKTTSSHKWRTGPGGPQTLCNPCGLQYAKRRQRARNEQAVAGTSSTATTGSGSPITSPNAVVNGGLCPPQTSPAETTEGTPSPLSVSADFSPDGSLENSLTRYGSGAGGGGGGGGGGTGGSASSSNLSAGYYNYIIASASAGNNSNSNVNGNGNSSGSLGMYSSLPPLPVDSASGMFTSGCGSANGSGSGGSGLGTAEAAADSGRRGGFAGDDNAAVFTPSFTAALDELYSDPTMSLLDQHQHQHQHQHQPMHTHSHTHQHMYADTLSMSLADSHFTMPPPATPKPR